MVFWIGAAIAAGGAIYSALSARRENQRAEGLSNTAHQREVADLRAAGLNPILSATGGRGATTPPLHVPGVKAGEIANTARLVGSQTKLLGAQKDTELYKTDVARATARKTNADAAIRELEYHRFKLQSQIFKGPHSAVSVIGEKGRQIKRGIPEAAATAKSLIEGHLKEGVSKYFKWAERVGKPKGYEKPYFHPKKKYMKGETIPPGTQGYWVMHRDKPVYFQGTGGKKK